jgi:hypothetical protein
MSESDEAPNGSNPPRFAALRPCTKSRSYSRTYGRRHVRSQIAILAENHREVALSTANRVRIAAISGKLARYS